jgi:hypothetical protein
MGGSSTRKPVEQFPDINKLCDVASYWIYEYIGILLGARPILHISRITVKTISYTVRLYSTMFLWQSNFTNQNTVAVRCLFSDSPYHQRMLRTPEAVEHHGNPWSRVGTCSILGIYLCVCACGLVRPRQFRCDRRNINQCARTRTHSLTHKTLQFYLPLNLSVLSLFRPFWTKIYEGVGFIHWLRYVSLFFETFWFHLHVLVLSVSFCPDQIPFLCPL